jgi:hypothetical protein
MRTDPLRPWRGLDMHFSGAERQIFGSIQDIVLDLSVLIPRRPREALVEHSSITDITGALSDLALWQYVHAWVKLRSVQLSAKPNRLVWRWTTNGQYTSKSCYNALFLGRIDIKLLEAQLEVLGAPKGEVLHLASLSGQMLDPGAASTVSTCAACCAISRRRR